MMLLRPFQLLRAQHSAALGLYKTPKIHSRPPWVCNSCLSHRNGPAPRLFSTTSRSSSEGSSEGSPEGSPEGSSEPPPDPKPYYITTPIFYVNAAPHIGHLHTMVLADVLKRWHMLANPTAPPAFLSTGTDEHGLKVQQAAEAASVTPQALCDANSQRFRDLAASANVSHDFFVRTSDERHRVAVQHFWNELVAKGHVYKAPRSGWYSVSDECFYKDTETERRAHPRTGTVIRVATATGNEVTWTEEENYHFRLTTFKDRLLALYKENPAMIKPAERQNEVVSWIESSISDLSISRPSSRLQWGVPVPDDPSQTIYVWVDALINYIVQAGYPSPDAFSAPTSLWPANVHVIGKDITRFHCVYWPALLMATNLPLPRSFLTHAHWTMAARKMSKSLGNVVDPVKQLQRWGTDPLRYFLMAEAGAMADDKSYSNDRVFMRYRELASKIGNVYQRLRPFSTGRCVREVLIDKTVPLLPKGEKAPALLGLILFLPGRVRGAMNKADISTALRHILATMSECHAYIDKVTPWKRELTDPALVRLVCIVMETCRIVAIMLQPIMPDKAAMMLSNLGVGRDRCRWADTNVGADLDYPNGLTERGLYYPILFPQLRKDPSWWREESQEIRASLEAAAEFVRVKEEGEESGKEEEATKEESTKEQESTKEEETTK